MRDNGQRTFMRAIILLLIGLLAGALCGGGFVYIKFKAYANKSSELSEAATIMATVRALEALRRSDMASGVKTLETHLNAALITFCCSPTLTKEGRRSIQEARRYRLRYPFNGNDQNVDDAINRLLQDDGK